MKNQESFPHGLLYSVAPDFMPSLHLLDDVESVRLRMVRKQSQPKDHHDINLTLAQHIDEHSNALLKAKEAVECANRTKTAFLANMSHELRTPLNAILGFANLLERDETMSEENRRKLTVISHEGQHLLKLINDVLDISQIEAGRIVIQREAFDIAGMLISVEDMIRPRAENKGLVFHIEQSVSLPPFVVGDCFHLKQVLINLLWNATKFTDKGHIQLRVNCCEGEMIRFEVTDTGNGISAEDQEHVFQAFYQTREGIDKGEGTGLGLYLSANYAQLMEGHLKMRSKLGQGSVFTLTVPLPACNAQVANQSTEKAIILASAQKAVMAGEVDLTRLSPDVVRELRAASEELDLDRIKQIVKQLREANPTLAAGLDKLIQGFRFDLITDLCKAAEESR